MRLAKKIAAIALAAVMSVSLLTACSGDGPSSSGSNSSGGSSSSTSSSSSGSSAGSSSGSTTSSSSSSSGSTSSEENVLYEKSRTAKFFKKLGTSYTMDMKTMAIGNDESVTARMLYSTDGNRIYAKVTTRSDGEETTAITLGDRIQRKGWMVIPSEEEVMEGKHGIYYAVDWDDASDSDDAVEDVQPVTGIKFTRETRGIYYVEIQTVEQNNEKTVLSYWYEGNKSVPKYIDLTDYKNGREVASVRTEINSVEFKVNTQYMNFEAILEQYVDMTGMIPDGVQN